MRESYGYIPHNRSVPAKISDLDISYYDDLNEYQSKFIEIIMSKGANIIFSVTYRHPRKPSNNTYINNLKKKLSDIQKEHKIYTTFANT